MEQPPSVHVAVALPGVWFCSTIPLILLILAADISEEGGTPCAVHKSSCFSCCGGALCCMMSITRYEAQTTCATLYLTNKSV